MDNVLIFIPILTLILSLFFERRRFFTVCHGSDYTIIGEYLLYFGYLFYNVFSLIMSCKEVVINLTDPGAFTSNALLSTKIIQ
jgi:hypothetical protein